MSPNPFFLYAPHYTFRSVDEVRVKYGELEEMMRLMNPSDSKGTLEATNPPDDTGSTTSSSLFPPSTNDLSLLSLLSSIRKTSAILEYDEFLSVTDALSYISHVQSFFSSKENSDAFPALTSLAGDKVYVDPTLLESLSKAFDQQTGQLSLKAYPKLAALRSLISEKKQLIQSTLASIGEAEAKFSNRQNLLCPD